MVGASYTDILVVKWCFLYPVVGASYTDVAMSPPTREPKQILGSRYRPSREKGLHQLIVTLYTLYIYPFCAQSTDANAVRGTACTESKNKTFIYNTIIWFFILKRTRKRAKCLKFFISSIENLSPLFQFVSTLFKFLSPLLKLIFLLEFILACYQLGHSRR